MPRVKTLRTKKPPKGWDIIQETLENINNKMREVENEPNEFKRKPEGIWPIMRIHHQRSRYIYKMFYKKKAISRELYEFCLREKYGDANLIAKWKKKGFEKLCCLQCIQKSDNQFGGTCICRVPKDKLEEDKVIECLKCGCRGCASGD